MMPMSLITAYAQEVGQTVAALAGNTTEFGGGTGTPDNPYLISSKQHLDNVRKYLNASFKLMADITFTEADFSPTGSFYNNGEGWKPIGGGYNSSFSGVFDGNNHTIKGLYIDSKDRYVGLFGYNRGTIKNLGILESSVKNSSFRACAGGIAGYNYWGTITNCYNTGDVSANSDEYNSYSGGITGYSEEGTITNCYNTGNVSASSGSSLSYAGGITAETINGTITGCYNAGTVYSLFLTGGIVGRNSAAVTNCYNTGKVDSDECVGGITGCNFDYGSVTDCYNAGDVYSDMTGTDVGGITGSNYPPCSITNCYNAGNVSVNDFSRNSWSSFCCGGITGGNSGTIANCYNAGTVSASALSSTSSSNPYAGGISGSNSGTIIDCHNVDNVSADVSDETRASPYAGGIVARNLDTITNCYNAGNVSASTSSLNSYSGPYAGGIAADNEDGVFTNCYNAGNVSASIFSSDTYSDSYAGGIVARNKSSVFSNCYNTGNVFASTTSSSKLSYCYAGGIAADNEDGVFNNCYYLDNIENGVASGTGDPIKCTMNQMKQQDTFAGFDFYEVWEIDSYHNYSYPQLKNNRQEPIQSIELLTLPENPLVVMEDALPDLTGATVKITYTDEFEVTTDATLQMLAEFDPTQAGVQTFPLSYGGKVTEGTLTVKVTPKSIESIEVITPPDKTSYVMGQPLNPAGGELKIYYNNSTSDIIPLSEAQLSYPSDQTGTVAATAEYQGFTAEFSITVHERQIQSITPTELQKLVYLQGEPLDLTGAKLLITYVSEDNYTEEIPLVASMISGYNPDLVGQQEITVTYEGKTCSFFVRVEAKSLTSIEVSTLPNKTEYLEGEQLDLTGGKLSLIYNNSTREEINLEDSMVSGFDSAKVGKQTITVNYGGYSTTFTVTVNHAWEADFTIDQEPTFSEDGSKSIHCAVCDEVTNVQIIPANSSVTGVKIGGRAADALRINWTKNASAEGYIIEQYKSGKWVRIARIANNDTTTYRVEKLSPSTSYQFRIRAFAFDGATPLYGAYVNVNGKTNPSIMTGVKLGGRAADALRINWTKNASAEGYIIEQYASGQWVRIAKITNNTTTTYRVENLSPSTSYQFRIRAFAFDGTTALYGNYVNVSGKTNPSIMTGVKIGGRAADALRINWTKNASAEGYIIEQYKSGKWVRIARIANNDTTTYRVEKLSPSTSYQFRIRAFAFDGTTALYGNYANVNGKTNPSIMTGVKIGGRAADALRINWAKNASAEGYIIEQYVSGQWVRITKITNNTTTTYRVENLSPSTSYQFRIRAFAFDGTTALYGNYVNVSGKTNPSIMTGVEIGGRATDALRINWTKNASAEGYIIEQYKSGKWVRIARIANSDTTTYRVEKLSPSTSYQFRIRAFAFDETTALYGNYANVSGKTL